MSPHSRVQQGPIPDGIHSLLQELEGHRQRQQVPLVEVASHEELFLRHGNTLAEELLPCSKASLAQVAYLFDLSTLLIGRLESLAQGGSVAASVPCGLPGDAKATANLTHLLLRLQYQLFRLLVNHGVQRIEAVAGRWREFWQQQRRLGDNWFAEWPDGRRPLSTTWPWNNIRPSLLVLWGVCWMFYDAYGDDDLVRSSEGFWSRQGGQYLDGKQEEGKEKTRKDADDDQERWRAGCLPQAARPPPRIDTRRRMAAVRLPHPVWRRRAFTTFTACTKRASISILPSVSHHNPPRQSSSLLSIVVAGRATCLCQPAAAPVSVAQPARAESYPAVQRSISGSRRLCPQASIIRQRPPLLPCRSIPQTSAGILDRQVATQPTCPSWMPYNLDILAPPSQISLPSRRTPRFAV